MPLAQAEVAVRGDLIERIDDARRQSDALFDIVKPCSLYERPIPERHRIIFYIGHLEAFDWNLLHGSLPGLKVFHPEFDRLFAFGIDPVGGGLPNDQPSDWPALENVREYVTKVRRVLNDKLQDEKRNSAVGDRGGFSLETLLNVAIEHRLMHLETLAYMLHQLPVSQKIQLNVVPDLVTAPVEPSMIDVPQGWAILGLRRDMGIFGWDNEFETNEVEVPAFAIDKYEVTNRQYLAFIKAGGYETRALWNDEDWEWKSNQGITHPGILEEGGWCVALSGNV